MCLIIQQPENDALTKAEVDDIYSRNRDGFGAMWLNDGKVQTWKTVPSNAKQAWEAYRHFAGHECVLHWRMATHGAVVEENAHPFEVTEGIALVHNGVLSAYGSAASSDTRAWIDQYLRPLLLHVRLDVASEAIEGSIKGSAIVLMTPDGPKRYGNKGVEHAGRWYSNTYAWNAPRELVPWWNHRIKALSVHDSYWDRDHRDNVDETEDAEIWYDEETELCDGGEAELCAFLADCVERNDVFLADLLLDEKTDSETLEWAIEQALDELQSKVASGLSLVHHAGYLAVIADDSREGYAID